MLITSRGPRKQEGYMAKDSQNRKRKGAGKRKLKLNKEPLRDLNVPAREKGALKGGVRAGRRTDP
jgi:hypothetical protein